MINGIVPAIVGIVIAGAGIALLFKSRATSHWRRVAGTVVEVAIETRGGDIGSRPTTVFYSPKLHYKYVFNGVIHRGWRILGEKVSMRASAVASGRQYIAGQAIDVFVDERRPHRHALERGMNHQYWLLVVVGVFWIGLALQL
ncbi:hypothetical protein CR152_29365 [Massilia violaceinigra]|uniref:DUF3592 domain-containing protein n=1 Tax=Massilia violaceinigra TaxID=2045208 RepID=A0A2D2DT54_9BURK|nr:DUF3592 domain-containing protein [Massilia violaceinigra]ATQ78165.1 hypothetical protein CR152_29365 [Massilia violaceinigra]